MIQQWLIVSSIICHRVIWEAPSCWTHYGKVVERLGQFLGGMRVTSELSPWSNSMAFITNLSHVWDIGPLAQYGILHSTVLCNYTDYIHYPPHAVNLNFGMHLQPLNTPLFVINGGYHICARLLGPLRVDLSFMFAFLASKDFPSVHK